MDKQDIVKRIMITGAAGYIGSHTALALSKNKNKFQILALDNFYNSHKEIMSILIRNNKNIKFIEVDICNVTKLFKIFSDFKPDIVLHFAGFKSIELAEKDPFNTYYNNVNGSLNILKCMDQICCKKIIFSSSATVYGKPKYLPYDEEHPLAPVNDYGKSKLLVEDFLSSWTKNDICKSVVSLRYFNPVSANSKDGIGEFPKITSNNLFPNIGKVLKGKVKELKIFGNNYPTNDGTCIRDFIHIEDLVEGHISAIKFSLSNFGFNSFNLGTGKGFTVLEIVKSIEKISGIKIPIKFKKNRPGDLTSYYADISKAKKLLNWTCKKNLHDICIDFIKGNRLKLFD